MRRTLIFAVVLGTQCLLAQTQTLPQKQVYPVEYLLSQAMTDNHIPGASIGIVMNGVPVWTHGYGMADVENDVPASDVTLYRLGSISKPLSAVAAMTLVEQHKMELDVPVQKYCAAFPTKQWPITMRELLSHTAGIRHYKPTDPDVEHGAEETRHFNTTAEALAKFENDPLEFQPGTRFGYSTYGYTVVGCAIEGASGENFYDYLRQAVLAPAGMTHTVVDNLQAIVPHRTRGYDVLDGNVINAGLMDSSYKIPGGGMVSDADDMAQFMAAMMAHKILSEQTTALMWTPVKTTEGKTSGYGLGFGTANLNGWQVVAHSGAQKGTSTILMMVPEKQFGLVILCNSEGQGKVLNQLAKQITQQLLAATPAAQ